MSLLEVNKLSHKYIEKTLYDNAAFELYKGEHMGVVGENGVGKSTLIKILTGELIPDKGDIKWQTGIDIGHLDQYAEINQDYTIEEYLKTAFKQLFEVEQKMIMLYEESAISGDEQKLLKAANCQDRLEKGEFYEIDTKISKVSSGLGINAMGLERSVKTLSGGQRAKVILAKLLLQNPDVLLLDEPTNFLDMEHVDWLSEYLKNFNGAFIVVSHDMEFLNSITTAILNIEFEIIKKYRGKYTDFLKQKGQLQEDYIRRYTEQQKMIKKTEEFIRRNIAGVNTKMAQGRRTQLERVERITPPKHSHSIDIEFKKMPLASQKALVVKDLEIGYTSPLLPKLNFTVRGGEKFVITGFNGIGKSTLLKTLIGQIEAISGSFRFIDRVKIGYYEQDLVWENKELTPLQIISEQFQDMTTKEVRKHLARCGLTDKKVMQSVGTLSGGEQSKVKLCKLILSTCNFLILDEPTNHFDIESKEAIKEAIKKFEGSVILVSHEESFYIDIADRIYNIEDCFN